MYVLVAGDDLKKEMLNIQCSMLNVQLNLRAL